MRLHRLLSMARIWLPLALICAVLGGVVAYAVASRLPPSYLSTASLMVGPPPGRSNVAINDVLVGQALTGTYAQIAKTRTTLQAAIADTRLPVSVSDLESHVSTRAQSDSNLLEISVSYETPTGAAALANAIAKELAAYLNSKDTSAAIIVTLVDPAVPPTAGENRIGVTTGLGVGIGLGLVVCLALVVEAFRREARAASDAIVPAGTAVRSSDRAADRVVDSASS